MKVSDWVHKIGENTKIEKLSLMLVGNKIDLDREVKEEEGKQFAQENNVRIYLCRCYFFKRVLRLQLMSTCSSP